MMVKAEISPDYGYQLSLGDMALDAGDMTQIYFTKSVRITAKQFLENLSICKICPLAIEKKDQPQIPFYDRPVFFMSNHSSP